MLSTSTELNAKLFTIAPYPTYLLSLFCVFISFYARLCFCCLHHFALNCSFCRKTVIPYRCSGIGATYFIIFSAMKNSLKTPLEIFSVSSRCTARVGAQKNGRWQGGYVCIYIKHERIYEIWQSHGGSV